MSALRRQVTAHNRFVGAAARERGAANEARLLDAVLALRASGTSWILDARRATPDEDAAGADVVVTADVGALYLQSNSSRAGLAKFAAKARPLRVEAVVVSLDDATTRARALVALSALREEGMRPTTSVVWLDGEALLAAQRLGRACGLCGAPAHIAARWRRVEDGAHVCERCCEDLDSFANVVTAEAAK